MDEEEGIYRDEVMEILGALADIKVAVLRILGYIEGEDDEEEEEEDSSRRLRNAPNGSSIRRPGCGS